MGITNQRATTIVFDPRTGVAVGPPLSWQDLRTVDRLSRPAGRRTAARAEPIRHQGRGGSLDQAGDAPRRTSRFATIETWIAWHLSDGDAYVTDRSNASVTGLVDARRSRVGSVTSWRYSGLTRLDARPCSSTPSATSARREHLPGSPRITALVGDQPASLFGQSCVHAWRQDHLRHRAPCSTWFTAPAAPALDEPTRVGLLSHGRARVATAPSRGGSRESSLVPDRASNGWWTSASSRRRGESEALAAIASRRATASSSCRALRASARRGGTSGRGAASLGSPAVRTWPILVRAVLEGSGPARRRPRRRRRSARSVQSSLSVRVDGGMSANRFFVQRLADFSGRAVAVSSEREATTRGAGLMALVGAGHLALDDVEALWSPARSSLTPHSSEAERTLAARASGQRRRARRADNSRALVRSRSNSPRGVRERLAECRDLVQRRPSRASDPRGWFRATMPVTTPSRA